MTWTVDEEARAAAELAAAADLLLRGVVWSCKSERAAHLLRRTADPDGWRYLRVRAQFVRESLGLAHTTARRFAGRGVEEGDLVAEGGLALLIAIDRWVPVPGIRFSAYALSYIRSRILQRLRHERRRRAHQADVPSDGGRWRHDTDDADTTGAPAWRNSPSLVADETTAADAGLAWSRAAPLVRRLSAPHRRMLHLLYVDGLTLAEVAACDGVHTRTACRTRRIVLRRLRVLLGGDR